ncbi:SUF system NifU family Fe-S cluster assembly protein [bacterium]|nr:MAG: SUF system NifU family Fe-S cluster assembly protein [bacterium]
MSIGIYNDQITYHSKNPRNFGEMENADIKIKGHNPLCGDSFEFFIKLAENGTIDSVQFTGKGCAVSTASASMMTKAAKGKTLDEVETLFKEFQMMSTGKLDVDQEPNHLGHLTVFKSIKDFPVRVKCATLPWHTLHSAMIGQKTATTE